MGKILTIGLDVNVASEVTFIPGSETKKNKAIFTIINNRGTKEKPLKDEVTLNVWGKYAGVASCFIYPGKQINFEGRLQSYTIDTGTVNAAQKKILHRKNEVAVDTIYLLGDSLKELNRRLAVNIAALKAIGQLPQTVNLSVEQLLKNPDAHALVEFNAAISAINGKYGLANVWTKDRKFWKDALGILAAPAVTTGAVDTPASLAAEIVKLQQRMVAMQTGVTAPAPAIVETPVMEMEAGMGDAVIEEVPTDTKLFDDAE